MLESQEIYENSKKAIHLNDHVDLYHSDWYDLLC